MSIKGNVYRLLSNHLKSKLTFDQSVPGALPSIKWIDKYNSQILNLAKELPIPYPAIFLQFVTFNWTTASNKVQKGSGIIRVYVAFENYADSYLGSVNQDKALAFFEFNQEVYKALEGTSGPGFTGLSRVTDTEDVDHDMLILSVTDYSTQLLDDSADETKNHQLVDPDVIVIKGERPVVTPANNDFIIP